MPARHNIQYVVGTYIIIFRVHVCVCVCVYVCVCEGEGVPPPPLQIFIISGLPFQACATRTLIRGMLDCSKLLARQLSVTV